MSADFTGTLQPVYTVRLAVSEDVQLGWIPGSESPVKLSLALRDHASLTPAAGHALNGAILILHMRPEEAIKIYFEIKELAETMGWPLSI